MSNETPIVVAPRPVRLSTAFFNRTDDSKLAFTVSDSGNSRSQSRASPKSALPSEALEEFFSILIHQPRSLSFPAFLTEQNFNFRAVQQPREHDQPSDSTRQVESPKADMSKPPAQLDTDVRWISSVFLSSPISRTHTRNPFQRHHELRSPAPVLPLTPRAVPLPSPTPDEFIETI